jgi:hypothetical protein
VEEYITAISTVGFPIVAYLLMVFKFDKSIAILTTAVNNNTTAIKILLEKEGENK